MVGVILDQADTLECSMTRMMIQSLLLAVMLPAPAGAFAADETADALQAIRAVGAGAEGAAEARAATARLIDGGEANLIPILKAFQGASPLAANWLRNAFEAIAADLRTDGRTLPEDVLTAFVRDRAESPDARRLAYEWLIQQNSGLKDELIPQMLLDPNPEFRRDAVSMLIEAASAAESPGQGTLLYRRAFTGAVHEDQVRTIAKALRAAGEKVDIPGHLGFLTQWKIIGPFDNRDEAGFAVAYPPESALDLNARYDGQLGPVQWQAIATEDDFGIVDIAKQIQNYKGSAMYAAATFRNDRDRQVELRLGTPNAWKLWVNEKLVFEREEYHRSSEMDQYRVPVALTAGNNIIMLKICQNEMTEDWAQRYQFQIRVTDATGSAVKPALSEARRGRAESRGD